ncbi:uncharacterized protein LOC114315992 isoform X2 [Camellia sinensis]|uniref:uncharacterized protein LOC114315992 isoform X2 n=1 Tax=Camellia sinensis TaxID=4442 RepID=UPI0010356E0D|nr:uncharacterized protein LOC114315992 isoform X2 [Camellia sinensis]
MAYIMDTNEEERVKGKTVEVGRAHFETKTSRFIILDAPVQLIPKEPERKSLSATHANNLQFFFLPSETDHLWSFKNM